MRTILALLLLLFAASAEAQFSMGSKSAGTAINGWTYCREARIDHLKVPNTAIVPVSFADFPAPFTSNISPELGADLKLVANGGHVTSSSGFDIAFFPDALGGAGGAKLDHKIKKYNGTTGEFSALFRQTLSTAVDAVPHICYGKSSITTSQENAAAVFNSRYQSYYSFDDVGGGVDPTDATANALHGKIAGATLVEGKVDGAAHFTAASEQQINFSNPTPFWTLSNITIGLWYHLDSAPGGGSESPRYTLFYLRGGPKLLLSVSNQVGSGVRLDIDLTTLGLGSAVLTENIEAFAGDTKHVVARHDVATHTTSLFINGSLVRTYDQSLRTYDFYPAIPNTFDTLLMGGNNLDAANCCAMDGWIDEPWVTNGAETDDWIKAGYLMQNNPSYMMSIGPRL